MLGFGSLDITVVMNEKKLLHTHTRDLRKLILVYISKLCWYSFKLCWFILIPILIPICWTMEWTIDVDLLIPMAEYTSHFVSNVNYVSYASVCSLCILLWTVLRWKQVYIPSFIWSSSDLVVYAIVVVSWNRCWGLPSWYNIIELIPF